VGKPDPPQPPNPVDTARASTSTNVATSIANAFLNNTNQSTPNGDLFYDVTGNYQWNDPYTGLNVDIPTFTATQVMSEQQRAINDQNLSAKYNLAGMANAQSDRLSQWLANNIDINGAPGAGDPNSIAGVPKAATTFGDAGQQQTTFGDAGAITRDYGPADNFSADRQRVEESLYGRLNPQLARERSNIEQRLADQGIQYGSQAYTSAMDDYNRQSNDARLAVTAAGGQEQQRMNDMAAQRAGFQNAAQQQAYEQAQGRGTFANQAQANQFQQVAARGEFQNAGLAQQVAQGQSAFNAQNMARNQFMNEQFGIRNQPINEISALLSGSQINNPNFVNTPNNQIPTTDVAGLINTRFSQDMDIYKQESQQQQALMGGIFGMLGGMMKMSDERQKEDIVKVGSVFATDVDHDEPKAATKDPDKDEVPMGGVMGVDGDKKKLPIYSYTYKQDPTKQRHVGPMAQDVEKLDKGAVKTRGGIKYIEPRRVMGNVFSTAQAG
jgi:Chaperone of endosialidase